jgi:glycosyltransferase involved in cell wall biosynthesis
MAPEPPTPLVSVVIPVLNGERFLAAAIRSVLNQTYRPLEVIVVDDGSSDRSAAVARSFAGVRVIEQQHAGPGAARNRGVAAAAGELLAFLDADDLMPADKLRVQVAHLRDHPAAGCVLGRQEVFTETGDEPRWAVLPGSWRERHPELLERGSLQPLSLVARRSVVDAVGDFSSEFGEDVDWLCRIWGAGVRVDIIDAVVVRRRVHGANLTHDTGASRLAMFRALKRHAERSRAASRPRHLEER